MSAEFPQINLKANDKIIMLALGLLALGVGGVSLYLALPYLIALATNLIIFLAELAAIIIVPTLLYTERTSILYAWKNFARKLRRKIVADDPIGTLDTAISRFEEKKKDVAENMTLAKSARIQQQKSIQEFGKKRDDARRLAQVAQEGGKPETTVNIYLTQALRWENAAEQIRPLLSTLLKTEERMEDAQQLVAETLLDLRGQRETLSDVLTSMKAGQKAVRSMSNFFSSNEDLDMVQTAVDEIEIQTSLAEAEIDSFLNNIAPLVDANDLKKQADAAAAVEKFGNFTKKNQLTEGTGTPLIEATVVPEKVKR